jgi:hypothetical protein
MRYRKEEPPRRTTVLQRGLPENIVDSKYNRATGSVNTPIKAQDKIIGCLQGHTFVKRVQGSKHQLRKPPAWCISKDAFVQEILPNVSRIVVEDTETGRYYESSTQTFETHSFEIQRGSYEPQLALGLNFWQVSSTGHDQLTLWGKHEW